MSLACVLVVGCGKRNTPEQSGSLRQAAREGSVERVQRVLSRGVDVNGRSQTGRTALHEAASGGHFAVAEVLIAHRANLNAEDKGGSTPLHEAAEQGHKELVELLLAAGARVNPVDRSGWTPAIAAMAADHKAIVEYLVNAGASVTLHMAAYLGDVDRVRELVANEADVGAPVQPCTRINRYGTPAAGGWTPLHFAAQSSQRIVAEVLVAAGANVNAQPTDGPTPLHVAASWDSADVAGLLLRNGADLHAHQRLYGTALDVAAHYGNVDVARVLVAGGATVNDGPWGSEPLLHAAEEGWTSMVEFLLQAGADGDTVRKYKGWPDHPVLNIAVQHGYIGIARLLAPRVDDINRRGASQCTPLHEAVNASCGHQMAAYEIRIRNADLNRASEDCYAVVKQDPNELRLRLIRLLLDHGADVNVSTDVGRTPLHEAADYDRADVAELLIARGANVNAATTTGETALHIACGNLWDSETTVRLLLDNRAHPNKTDQHGWTPLAEALHRGHVQIARMLIAAGAQKVNLSDLKDGQLHEALREKNQEWIELLVEHGADIDERGWDANTPLHVAVVRGDNELAGLFLDHGADVNARNKIGRTPLHYAAYRGWADIAEILLARGADVGTKDKDGNTPLDEATRRGHKAVVDLLRSHQGKE